VLEGKKPKEVRLRPVAEVGREIAREGFAVKKAATVESLTGAVILTPVVKLMGAEIVMVIIFSLNNIFELKSLTTFVSIIIYQEKKCNCVF
jgi:hypothetical protein